jgi:pectate lyase-like protein
MLRTGRYTSAGVVVGIVLGGLALAGPPAHSATTVQATEEAQTVRAANLQTLAVFDVTTFGATGDGVTNDAPAFRSAIAAADAAAGTNTVLIPAGTYLMDADGNGTPGIIEMDGVTNVDVVGEGASSVVKYKPRDWTTQSDPHLFACEDCAFVSFSDFAIDGSKGAPGFVGQERMHGIQLLDSHDITVQQLTIFNSFGDGVELFGEPGITEDVTISDNDFLDNGRSGIGVQGGTRLVDILTNHFEGTSDQDIDFEPTGSTGGRPAPTDFLIQGNTIEHSTAPYSVTIGGQTITNRAQRIQFLDNIVTNGTVRLYNADDILVEGNTIDGTVARPDPMLRVEGETSDITIRDNTVEGSTPGLPVVELRALGANLPDDILVDLNRVRQFAASDGIRIDQTMGPVVVTGNEITGPGSGAGVRYRVSVDDGLVREDATISNNEIVNFDGAAVAIQALGTGVIGDVTMCGNDVSQGPLGIDIEVPDPAFLAEVDVCTNVWAVEVTTRVRTNGVTHFRGTGTPEGIVAAPVGSDFIRTDEANRLYVKQTGTGKTGWVGT